MPLHIPTLQCLCLCLDFTCNLHNHAQSNCLQGLNLSKGQFLFHFDLHRLLFSSLVAIITSTYFTSSAFAEPVNVEVTVSDPALCV